MPLPLQLLEMTFSCKDVGSCSWQLSAIAQSGATSYDGVYAQKKLKFLTSFYLRIVLFFVITQRVEVIFVDVSGQLTGLISGAKNSGILNISTPEDGTDKLCGKVGEKLLLLAA